MSPSLPEVSGSAPMRVQVLGPLRVMRGGEEVDLRGPRPRLLLGILVASADQVVALGRLIDDLYGEDPPPTARKSAQVHISNLRRAFGDDGPLTTSPGGYMFDSSGVEVDAIVFEREVGVGVALAASDPERASAGLAAALGLWRGAPYSDLGGEPALQAEIVRLNELRLRAVEQRIEVDLELGRHGGLLGELETLVIDHPYREELRALQMLALYRSGRQADALGVYRKTRNLLVEELGIEPSAALRDLEQQILDQSPSLDLVEVPGRTVRALLVSDIEDSTALWEQDPERMGEALARHDAILSKVIAGFGGEIFKRTGDGVFAVFATVGGAAGAGAEAQLRFGSQRWVTDRPIRVRMAVDEGPVERRGDDYFGPVLNRVMRVMSAGHGGQLLTTDGALVGIDQPTRPLGDYDLKGVGRVGVHQVTADGLDAEFPELRTDRTPLALARPGFTRAIRGYELREELGVGDFGIVYRAYQASVGREVAVKVIRPEFANRPDFVKRFEAEAQFVAQLEHPHIVSLYDYWRDPEGAYLVMNHLRGGSLAQALERGRWNPPTTLRLVDQIGTALGYAHRNGVTHRDIKPGNVLLDDDGNAYLSDFGIAARVLDPADEAQHTSIAYLAPEQLVGSQVDARSDIYSLALLTYETLTGHRPDLGGQPRSVREVRYDLPAELDVIFDRATNPTPESRYQRVEEFLRGLRQALGADVAASAAPVVDVDVRNPFKGLRAFTEVDAGDFYGREALVDQLIDTIRTHGLTAAVGPSGCGKSSVVKAGLLPAVRAGRLGADVDCVIAEMFPGSYPFEELEACLLRVAVDRPDGLLGDLEHDERGLLRVSKRILPDDHTSLLLVIDQFEELFSLVTDETVRTRFLDSLVTVAHDDRSRVKVLITMRADFFDRPLRHPDFGDVLNQGLVPIAMPGSDSLASAISQPARSVGLDLQPGLVTAVLADVADQPGGLPLMQYAMTELVDRRQGHNLTLDAYHSTGGAGGALARRAEDIYTGLPPAGQAATRDLFLRLVAVSEESDDTRRRVRLSELSSIAADQGALDTAIDEYGAFRLLSFDHDPVTRGPTVEVAHEALIREWPRYREWVDDQRDDLLLGRRLETAARDWDEGDRDPSFLLRGGRLEQYQNWTNNTDLRTTHLEQDYLDASKQLAIVLEREREEQQHRDQSLRRRSRLLVTSAIAAVMMLALAAVALVSRNRAEAERQKALEQQEITEELGRAVAAPARARELAAEANGVFDDDPGLAATLAVAAIRATEQSGAAEPEAVDALHWALQADGTAFPADESTPIAVRPSPRGPRGVFALSIDELVALARDGHIRPLAQNECERYFPGEDCPDPGAPMRPSLGVVGGLEAYQEFTDPVAPLSGTTVTIGGWEDEDSGFAMRQAVERIVDGTGVRMVYARVDVRDPGTPGPDIDLVYAEQTEWIRDAAESHRIVDLAGFVDVDDAEKRFGSLLLPENRSDARSIEAIPVYGVTRSMVYYDKSRFAENGYEAPTTWEDLIALSDRIVDDGLAPWCWANGRVDDFSTRDVVPGSVSLTDWISTLLLSESGPDTYASWASGELPFSSEPVRRAFRRLEDLVFTEGYTAGSPEAVVAAIFVEPILDHGLHAFFDGPRPECVMKMAPSYALPFDFDYDLDYFAFPAIEEANGGYLIGDAYLMAMTEDRPENRAVLEAMMDSEYYDFYLDRSPGFIPPDLTYQWQPLDPDPSPEFEPQPRDFRLIDEVHAAIRDERFVWAAANQMPVEVGMDAFWNEPVRWFSNPDELDDILAALDEARANATR